MIIPAKEFYMIRHPETVANAGGFYSGHLDVTITPLGIKQVDDAKIVIGGIKDTLRYIFHSNLQRTKIPALMINKDLDLPVFETALLAEQHYGDWQGQLKTEIGSSFQKNVDPPNGETRADFMARVQKGITLALNHQEGTPLIISHGGVFKSFYRLHGQEIPEGTKNCVLHKFTPAPDKPDMPWTIEPFA